MNTNERIDRVEKLLKKHSNEAPSIPIYDPENFPQDAFEGQIAIGTDGNLYSYINGGWGTGTGIHWGINNDYYNIGLIINTFGSGDSATFEIISASGDSSISLFAQNPSLESSVFFVDSSDQINSLSTPSIVLRSRDGRIYLQCPLIITEALPTSNPGITGALWNSGGVIHISP